MAELKIPKTPSAIQKLAKAEFDKKATKQRRADIPYREGADNAKVWDNFQLPVVLKRQFKELCAKKNINASKYFRACIRILIRNEGVLKKTVEDLEELNVKEIKE